MGKQGALLLAKKRRDDFEKAVQNALVVCSNGTNVDNGNVNNGDVDTGKNEQEKIRDLGEELKAFSNAFVAEVKTREELKTERAQLTKRFSAIDEKSQVWKDLYTPRLNLKRSLDLLNEYLPGGLYHK